MKYEKKKRRRKEGSRNKTDDWKTKEGGRVTANTRPQNRQPRENLSLSLFVCSRWSYVRWSTVVASIFVGKGETDMCSIFRHWPVFSRLSRIPLFHKPPRLCCCLRFSAWCIALDSLAPSSSSPSKTLLTGVFSSTPL